MTDLRNLDYCYDTEVYPNVFQIRFHSVKTGGRRTYEISERRNEFGPLKSFIERLQARGARMVGFNNMGYDYPVLHYLLIDLSTETDWKTICSKVYQKSKSIIEAPHERRFDHVIWARDQVIPQVDLFKIHHFDNKAKSTSLKMLEFNMRMDDIQELPFPPGKVLLPAEMEKLDSYLDHDVEATVLFYQHSLPALSFREALSAKYDRDFTNHNDTKIGKDYFVMQLERKLGKTSCFTKVDGKRKPVQTKRKQIALADVIFEYGEFETEPFRAVHRWLASQVIKETKGVFSDLTLEQMLPFIDYSPVGGKKKVMDWMAHCEEALTTGECPGDQLFDFYPPPKVNKSERRLSVLLDDVEFVFGTGGIHASLHNTRIEADDNETIIDLDVTSYYPSLAIANRVYPAHLGEQFCDIYGDTKEQRMKYAKGTPENAALKLALNGVYGDSNNKFSPFYDPQYTMSITVNGQLLLCMLYEKLRKIPDLKLIQVNTDGLTVKLPRHRVDELVECKTDWELLTGLELEQAEYEFMHIKDVNNYVAGYANSSKVKRKGAYEYELGWHQNHSALVVKKAACANIIDGTDIRDFIESHEDDWDFLLRTKVPRTSRLMADWGLGLEEQVQNISRYYIAKTGPELVKVMPPLPKKPDEWRRIGINKGFSVCVCNHFEGIDNDLINYDWYIAEAEKLVNFELEGA